MNMTRSVAGAYINCLEVVTSTLPGNFGVRVVEQMPTNLSDVWRERKSTQLGTMCLEEHIRIPELLGAPLKVDYPTDEDSDDNNQFSIKVPDLADLINEFEKDDDTLYKEAEA
jgi:hypothetical protein